MIDKKEIPVLLLYISRIKEGEKIVTANRTIHYADSYVDSLKRTFLYNENKNKTFGWMETIIDQAFQIYDELYTNDIEAGYPRENIEKAIKILSDIEKTKDGILNMKKTYSNDTYYCSKLDDLVSNIDIKIGLRNK